MPFFERATNVDARGSTYNYIIVKAGQVNLDHYAGNHIFPPPYGPQTTFCDGCPCQHMLQRSTRLSPLTRYSNIPMLLDTHNSRQKPWKGYSSDEKEVDMDHSPRPLRGGRKRKAARAPVPSLDDSDFDSEPMASTHQTKKSKRDDDGLRKGKGAGEPSGDDKRKKATDKIEGGSGRKVRVTGKARIKNVFIVEDSESDELEATPQAPSRPKPRPAFKGAAGASANLHSTSPPVPTAPPAASSSLPSQAAVLPPLSVDRQPVFAATNGGETRETKSDGILDRNPSALPLYGKPTPPIAHQPIFTVTTKTEETQENKLDGALDSNPVVFPPRYGQPAPPIPHHGPPLPHGFQYDHFPGYGYSHLPAMGPGPQQNFAGAGAQGTYGGIYHTHPAYPPYHLTFYLQNLLLPPQGDAGHQGGTSTSRSTPHE